MLAKSCFSRKIKCKFTPKRAAAQLPLFLVLTYTHFTLRKPRINPTKSVRRCESYVVILSLLWRLFFFFFFFFRFFSLDSKQNGPDCYPYPRGAVWPGWKRHACKYLKMSFAENFRLVQSGQNVVLVISLSKPLCAACYENYMHTYENKFIIMCFIVFVLCDI